MLRDSTEETTNPMERTFVAIKPDGVQRGLVGEVIGRLERRGLKLVAIRLMQVDAELAGRHYAEHISRPFFPSLVSFITSGPVVAMIWEAGNGNAVALARQTMGATNPAEAAPGTIRGDLGIDIGRNIVPRLRQPGVGGAGKSGCFLAPAPPWIMPAARTSGLQNPDHLRGADPQPFQPEKLPFLRAENMDDHIGEVQQHPAGRRGFLPGGAGKRRRLSLRWRDPPPGLQSGAPIRRSLPRSSPRKPSARAGQASRCRRPACRRRCQRLGGLLRWASELRRRRRHRGWGRLRLQ